MLARKAEEKDKKQILLILKGTDLYYPEIKLDGFWVAGEKGRIIGIAQFKEYKDYFFLSSVGVPTAEQKKGVASFLIKELLKSASKEVYLYTTMPDFFKRFNFRVVAKKEGLPSKEYYQCEECEPEKCVVMVREK